MENTEHARRFFTHAHLPNFARNLYPQTCYNTYIQTYTRNCFQCGSSLIFVSERTEKFEGSMFPQTTTIYRCSNLVCQAEKDRETAKRVGIQRAKDIAMKERLAAKKPVSLILKHS